MTTLTEHQTDVVRYIKHWARFGIVPSTTDIMRRFGLRNTSSARSIIARLKAAGAVTTDGGLKVVEPKGVSVADRSR